MITRYDSNLYETHGQYASIMDEDKDGSYVLLEDVRALIEARFNNARLSLPTERQAVADALKSLLDEL